jgi:hypothetical protein
MKVDLSSAQGIAEILRTYKIPADVWLDRNDLLVECKEKDVNRTDFLLFMLNLPMKVQVEGNLPWYRIQTKARM